MKRGQETHIEDVDKVSNAGPAPTTTRRQGYCALSEEELRLDKRINLKMDLTVVPVLALGFLVRPPPLMNDKTDQGA